MSALTDAQELQVMVAPRVTDRQLLQVAVYADRSADAVELQTVVVPVMTDAVQLRATVTNQAMTAAAAGRVLAPVIEVTFTVA
jgi:hypothetical protein